MADGSAPRRHVKVVDLFLRRAPPPPKARRAPSRAARSHRRWTPAEDAVLRKLTAPRGRNRARHCVDWPRVLAALPGRSKYSIARRRKLLRLTPSGTRWSPEEDATLRRVWTERSRAAVLRALPRRSYDAIAQRAEALGLTAIPQGWATLRSESRRLGVDPRLAARVAAWARACAPLVEALCAWGHQCSAAWARRCAALGVAYAPSVAPRDGFDGGAVAVKPHTTTLSSRRRGGHWPIVEVGALDDALDRWRRWETCRGAAARLGLDHLTLARALAAGRWCSYGTRKRRLMPPEWIEAAAAEAGLKPGGSSARAHALRRGLTPDVVLGALRRAGRAVRKGRGAKGFYLDDEVDAALAARGRARR